jgi:hypothetical protein
MHNILKFIITCSLAFSSSKGWCQANSEVQIYNSLMDSLYELQTCLKVIYPPFYKCCDTDTLYGGPLMKCCEKSAVPEQYKVYCANCVNKQQFDTLTVLMIVPESFSTLNILKHKKHLLSRVDKHSVYYNFIKNIHRPLIAGKLPADSLQQQNIKFITQKTFDKKGLYTDLANIKNKYGWGFSIFQEFILTEKKG